MEFQINHRVLVKMSPMKGVMRFQKKGMLSPRYIGPYRMLNIFNKVDYELEFPKKELEFPTELAVVHPIFHISLLKICVGDPISIVLLKSVVVKDSRTYEDVAVEILDRQV